MSLLALAPRSAASRTGGRRLPPLLLATLLLAGACGESSEPKVEVPGSDGRLKSAPEVRTARRAFDGAPPVIPHDPQGNACLACHNEQGLEVGGLGFAPAMPHERTSGLSDTSRCQQCHLYRRTDEVFVENELVAFRAKGDPAPRAHPEAPAPIPHRVFMRESCLSCHSGPAAREPIRTSHPERLHCRQCHVPVATDGEFSR